MISKWTIFGVSDLILEIIDAIYYNSNANTIKQIVINMPVKDSSVEDLKHYKIITLDNYKYDYELNIFGFTDPNKEAFLAKLSELPFSNVIHPKAHYSEFSAFLLGHGNYLAPGVVIGAKVSLGSHNFLNRNSSIGHHTQVNSFNHFGPGSIICGRCHIGSKNFFGAGSIVKDKVQIGNNVTIGAGAVVVSDILEAGVYVGIPAKRIVKNP